MHIGNHEQESYVILARYMNMPTYHAYRIRSVSFGTISESRSFPPWQWFRRHVTKQHLL